MERVRLVAGGKRNVDAEAEDVMLIDPGVIWIFLRARIALEAGARDRIERKAFRTFLAKLRARPVERPLALAPVEARDVTGVERHPHHAVSIDVATPNAEAGQRYLVDFRKRGFGRVGARRHAQNVTRVGEVRAPD